MTWNPKSKRMSSSRPRSSRFSMTTKMRMNSATRTIWTSIRMSRSCETPGRAKALRYRITVRRARGPTLQPDVETGEHAHTWCIDAGSVNAVIAVQCIRQGDVEPDLRGDRQAGPQIDADERRRL